DTYVVACFQNKNRFIFNVLLSLPNADLGLLVSKKDKSFFRPSLFDRKQHGVNDDNLRLSPLLHFAIQEWPKVVPDLLSLGAQVSSKDYYTYWVEKHYGRSIISNYYEFFNEGMSPLHVASILNNTTIMLQLIQKGADVNSLDEYERTPLHMAALYNNPEAIDILIEQGANKDCFYGELKTTPLTLAIHCRHTAVVTALLKHNCSLDYDINRLLYWAVANGQIGLISKLVENDPALLTNHLGLIKNGIISPAEYNSREFNWYKGLKTIYPYNDSFSYVKYIEVLKTSKKDLEFIHQLIALTENKDTQQKIRGIGLEFMLRLHKYDEVVAMLGLNSEVSNEDLLSDKEWLSLLSEYQSENNTIYSGTLLHGMVICIDEKDNNTVLVLDYLLTKAKEVSFDFCLKGGSGRTIHQTAQIWSGDASNELKQRLLELEQGSIRQKLIGKQRLLELEQGSIRQKLIDKINVAILGKDKVNNPKTELPIDDKTSYLGWMNLKATGTRGFSRFSHWYHGDSGVKRARDLLEIANNPEASYEVILSHLQNAFKDSSNHKHSLSRYLVAQFNGQDFAELKELKDESFTEIKTNFKFV
ncbi:MAG: ankyrin repeat domain-containing protein, partial [Tatlockia sp.]|nr:ankyrin repeat domain-containing protein [Tatlockia sp.]